MCVDSDIVDKWHKRSWLFILKKIVLFDPQTNGPLVISVDKKFVPIAEKLGFVYIGDVINNPEIIISNEWI